MAPALSTEAAVVNTPPPLGWKSAFGDQSSQLYELLVRQVVKSSVRHFPLISAFRSSVLLMLPFSSSVASLLTPCAQDLLGTIFQPNEAWERLLVGAGSEADRLLGCEPERLDRERFRRAVADRIPPNVDQPGRLCALLVHLPN